VFERAIESFSERLANWEVLPVDVVPAEELRLGVNDKLVLVHHMENGTTLTACDSQFFFVLRLAETVGELAARVREALGIGEAEFKRIGIIISQDMEPYTTDDGVVLTGEMAVKEAIQSYRRKEITEPKLVILHPPGRAKSRRREEVLKIYN
jgi:hypothetical protein